MPAVLGVVVVAVVVIVVGRQIELGWGLIERVLGWVLKDGGVDCARFRFIHRVINLDEILTRGKECWKALLSKRLERSW